MSRVIITSPTQFGDTAPIFYSIDVVVNKSEAHHSSLDVVFCLYFNRNLVLLSGDDCSPAFFVVNLLDDLFKKYHVSTWKFSVYVVF